VDCARSARAAARRRPGDRIMHASLRHSLTHRCEDPPAAGRHGAPYRVRPRATTRRRSHLGTALDIMRPGAGARDPDVVSLSAYPCGSVVSRLPSVGTAAMCQACSMAPGSIHSSRANPTPGALQGIPRARCRWSRPDRRPPRRTTIRRWAPPRPRDILDHPKRPSVPDRDGDQTPPGLLARRVGWRSRACEKQGPRPQKVIRASVGTQTARTQA
jgi:hypothetical protein